jgi:hypothetical protein
VIQADRVLALGDFGFVRVAQQGQVTEDRQLPAEGAVELDVLGKGRDPLLGPDDVGDAHEVVVDHVGEVVGRMAIGLQEHLVVDLGVSDDDIAAQQVMGHGLALGRHGEADDMLLALFTSLPSLLRVD